MHGPGGASKNVSKVGRAAPRPQSRGDGRANIGEFVKIVRADLRPWLRPHVRSNFWLCEWFEEGVFMFTPVPVYDS